VEQKLDYSTGVHLLLIQALQHCFSEFRGLLVFIFIGNLQLINILFSGPTIIQPPEEIPIYIDDLNRRILKFLWSSIRDSDDFRDSSEDAIQTRSRYSCLGTLIMQND
jgi:hypothetical protein